MAEQSKARMPLPRLVWRSHFTRLRVCANSPAAPQRCSHHPLLSKDAAFFVFVIRPSLMRRSQERAPARGGCTSLEGKHEGLGAALDAKFPGGPPLRQTPRANTAETSRRTKISVKASDLAAKQRNQEPIATSRCRAHEWYE